MAKTMETALEALDWDDMAIKLKSAFDAMANSASNATYNSDKRPFCDSMAAIADALVKVSAEARIVREKEQFKISKSQGT